MLASRGLMAVLSLAYLAVAARSLGITGFGRFALITGAVQALVSLVAFQTWQLVVRYGIDAIASNDPRRLARLLAGSVMLDIGSAATGCLIAAVVLEVWGSDLGIEPPLERAALLFAIVGVATIRSTPLGILRLRDRYKLAAVADSVTSIVRFLGAFTVAALHPTVQGFLAAWGVAELLTAAAYWWMAWRTGDLRLLRQGGDLGLLLSECPHILRYALSTNASATLGLANRQVPLLLVGATSGVAAAASYRLAAQVAQALTKVAQLFSRAAFPEMVKLVQVAPASKVKTLLLVSIGVSALAGAVILVATSLLGRATLDLIAGAHFAHSHGVLMWMSAAGCADLVATLLETFLMARGRAASALLVRLAAAATILGFAWFALPALGVNGMAVSVFVGALAGMVLMSVVAWFAVNPLEGERARKAAGNDVDVLPAIRRL